MENWRQPTHADPEMASSGYHFDGQVMTTGDFYALENTIPRAVQTMSLTLKVLHILVIWVRNQSAYQDQLIPAQNGPADERSIQSIKNQEA
jgi:hypothetical protein